MPTSKYPNQIDTSAELPVVRNNINEIGSDAINSLRSAIIQIEKVLGINPQGAIGNSVATRISQSLDSSGNLSKEALERANVLFGQITNDNISKVAAIDESKLKLNIPTQILQSQVSSISYLIDSIDAQIKELGILFSVHLNDSAINRHPATAISVAAFSGSSSESFQEINSATNVQSVIENIVSSHINYDGTSISELNNSHLASQIYYDNANYTTVIPSSDVQGAIDDLAASSSVILKEYKNYNNSNGLIRKSNIYDLNQNSYGILIASNVSISILQSTTSSKISTIIFSTDLAAPTFEIKKSDNISIIINDEEKIFQVYGVNYNLSDYSLISSIDIFGSFSEDLTTENCSIFYKKKQNYLKNSLLVTALQNTALTSSSSIIVNNLSSASATTKSIKAEEINLDNRYISISVNDGTAYKLDLYDTNKVSIDSIIKNLNEQFNSFLLPLSAYRLDDEISGSELIISTNVSTSDSYDLYFTISRSTDDAIDSVGFSYLEDKKISAKYSSSYEINGQEFYSLGVKLKTSLATFTASTNVITRSNDEIDFVTSNIKINDVITILGDGFNISLAITDVQFNQITVSADQLPSGFSSSSSEDLIFVVYDNTLNFSDYEFKEVSSSFGSTIFEIFIDQNNNLLYNPIAEVETPLLVDKPVISLVDFNNPFSISSSTLNFTQSDDGYVLISLGGGEEIKVIGNYNYLNLKSLNNNLECKVYIENVQNLYNYITLYSKTSSEIYFFENIDKNNNLVLSNVLYQNFSSTCGGGINGPKSISKLSYGNISETEISNIFVKNKINIHNKDLRSNGVIFGLDISSATVNVDGFFVFTTSSGVCYVSGKRLEIKSTENLITNITAGSGGTDKLYIGVDENGMIIFESCDPNCNYPWDDNSVCLIGSLEYSNSLVNIIDQRLFVNDLDLKLLNSINVSPQAGMGHFSEIPKAIRYAKRFSEIYPDAGTPEVHLKSGKYYIELIDETTDTYSTWLSNLAISGSTPRINFFNNFIKNGLFIDFPLVISGEGNSSEIECVYTITCSDQVATLTCGLMIAGTGFNTANTSATVYHDRISVDKVFIKNLKITEGWILLLDLNLPSSSNGYRRIDLHNIIFNDLNIDSATKKVFLFDSEKIYGTTFLEVDDTTESKGGVSIRDCIFNNGGKVILLPDTTPSRYYEIDISGCYGTNANGLSDPSFTNSAKFPSNSVSYSSNTGELSSSRHTKTQENLYVSGALTVKNSAIINSGGLVVVGNTAISGSTIVSSDISVLGTTGSGDVSAKSFTITGSNNLFKVIPISDFYSILQVAGSAFHSAVSFGDGLSTGLEVPATISFVTDAYIYLSIDSYLINAGKIVGVKIVCCNSGSISSDIEAKIYYVASTGTTSSFIGVGTATSSITGTTRAELSLDFSPQITINKVNLYYLRIKKQPSATTTFVYRVSLIQSYNNDIETALNVV
jgi:hypothetical protein